MEEQKQLLDETIEQWRGQLEQVDDICVIGVRIAHEDAVILSEAEGGVRV